MPEAGRFLFLSRKKSLQKRILMYFLLFTLLFACTSFILVSQIFFKNYVENLTENAVNSSNKTKQSIEFLLNMTDNTASLMATNQPLLDALRTIDDMDDYSYEGSKETIDAMLTSIISVHEFIDNIYVLGSDGEFYSSYWDADQRAIEARFAEFIRNQKKRQEYINGEPLVSYLPFFDLNVISYVRPIFQYPEDLGLGTLIIEMNYTYLREMFTFTSLEYDEEKILVINKKGDTIFTFPFNTSLEYIVQEYPVLLHENTVVNGKVFGDESIILSDDIAYSDWRIIQIYSKERVYQSVIYLTRLGMVFWILFILISIVISYRISVSITTPIIQLNNTIQKVENGNLKVRAEGEGEDEIGQLASSFNHMIQRLSDLMERTLDEQKKKSDLEFQILQSQINPHFLYNTLDSIKWLAVFQNVENISDMTTSLINLLKYNISKKTKLVTLKDEVNSIKDYLEIQKFRFGDAFTTVYDIDPKTEEASILKFILQPLVENAIFHGFDNIEYEGVITIRSFISGKKLILQIEDNGNGLTDNQNYLEQKSSYDHKKMHNSIGIRNVVDRISLYFGEEGHFSLKNAENQGVVVTITLPLLDSFAQLPEEVNEIMASMDKS